MNYGFWLLMGQSAQTGVMAAQMRQLGHINNELALQRLAQQHQAVLAQVLFETEQAAAQLTALAGHDVVAAAIHARVRLNAVQAIQPGLFAQYETKKAWAAATGQLNSLWMTVDSDARWSPFARRVIQAIETLRQWQAFIGDPGARLAQVKELAQRAKKSARLALLAIPTTLLVGFLLGMAGAAANVFLLTYFGSAVMVMGPIGGLISWLSRIGPSKRAGQELEQFEQQLAQFNAFLADPMGGLLLDQAAAQHPALAA